MHAISRALTWSALFVVLAAPAVAGCQPPWAWGFLLAALFALAALVLARAWYAPDERQTLQVIFSPPLRSLRLAAFGLLAWSSGACLYDLHQGTGLPALGLRSLAFAWAFVAAFLLGARWGLTGRRLRRVLRLVFAVCAAYAGVSVLQSMGWWPLRVLGWTPSADRFSGLYSNANRYAVLLAMGWSCGMALLGAKLALPGRPGAWTKRVWALAPEALGLLLLAAGISLSQSRLTILALGLALGVAVALELGGRWRVPLQPQAFPSPCSSVRTSNQAAGWYRKGSRAFLILAALLLPGLVFLAGTLTFSGHTLASRWSELADLDNPDPATRVRVMKAGWGLMVQKPYGGHGLGSFETAFMQVQPPELGGRWAQVHNDWLQLGIELGWPGLALAGTCAVCGLLVVWRALRAGRRRFRVRLLAYGGMTLLIPLFCSAADFPLREPATAALFFFLAGALCAACARSLSRVELRLGLVAQAGLAVLLVFFAGWGWYALRTGRAVARSPWRGSLFPPAPKVSDTRDYLAAMALEPDGPELPFPCARAQLAALLAAEPAEKSSARVALLQTLESMRALNPRDYRVPWLEAYLRADQAEFARAVDLLDQAVELAPNFLELRRTACAARLDEWVARTEPFTAARVEQLQRVFLHMRWLLRIHPGWEGDCVAALMGAGALPHEAAGLWPADDTACAWRRARFWMENGGWFWARQELVRVSAEDVPPGWLLVLRGRLSLEEGRIDPGVAAWLEALEEMNQTEARELERWMGGEVSRISVAAEIRLAERFVASGAHSIVVGLALAQRLAGEKKGLWAHRVLTVLARRQPTAEVYRLWAETARTLHDPWAARTYAEKAWELSGRALNWKSWLDSFETPKEHAPRGP